MKRTVVIMAGGSGERFWPLSRKRKPKQLLPLASEKSMIEESIERISSFISLLDIFIITSEVLLEPIRRAIPQLPSQNVIAEPHKRNTAPCLALSAAFIASKYKGQYKPNEISIAVLTADQSISPNEDFVRTIDAALNYVENEKALCTIGILPNRPETGFGYVEVATKFNYDNIKAEIVPIKAFHEKPDLDTAKKYVSSGKFLWNSGMFFWRLDTFIDSMKVCLPEVGNKIDVMQEKFKGKTEFVLPEALHSISSIFEALPNISIDYGLMERADNVVVAKALFNWDDIGSWDSLDRIKQTDENNNIIEGVLSLVDVKNSVIINASSKKDMIVAGLGLNNIVVVVTDDAVLVCPKEKVQDVKKCVNIIRADNSNKWL